MVFPAFFADAPAIRLRDPLAGFLGSAEDGVMTYRYADAVGLCGHSCPVVAGAWLMVLAGLEWLYGDDLPERGGIEVHMRDGVGQGIRLVGQFGDGHQRLDRFPAAPPAQQHPAAAQRQGHVQQPPAAGLADHQPVGQVG